jgi:hypothetical protein
VGQRGHGKSRGLCFFTKIENHLLRTVYFVYHKIRVL